MSEISIGKISDFSKGFVPAEYRQDGREEDALRLEQSRHNEYRSLSSDQIEILVKNNNTAEDWDRILVTHAFDPRLVRNCQFWGLVRIGNLSPSFLEYHELRIPVGFSNSTIICCDIGDDVAIHDVHYLAHYLIGDRVVLLNLDEMHTVNHAKFGNGIVKDGEPEAVRVWLEVGNETGGRRVLPFDGMLPADAYLWSRYREEPELLERFREMTDALVDSRRGYYGKVGDRSVIKNSRIIKDTLIGSDCYIKGANKLKNLTINSSAEEPTQIGEGVELVNGVVGYGNRIFYGVKAVRFVTDRNVQVKYGARLLNSYLGANSTVSCCELLNNLIFPFHEQHHNNSFLTASTLLGQANIAAAATIGSNHNSRAQDGEILAGRGFWPGLASSFKHSSRFASYVLAATGRYPCELDITLPFSLISVGDDQASIRVMPGYWFEHNMFALVRNARKYRARDRRVVKDQPIEYDFLAPDTAEEMIRGMEILRTAVEGALGRPLTAEDLQHAEELDASLQLKLDSMACKRPAHVLHPVRGYRWYRTMLRYYGAVELKGILQEALGAADPGGAAKRRPPRHPAGGAARAAAGSRPRDAAARALEAVQQACSEVHRSWDNVGGQIMPEPTVQGILTAIKKGHLDSWQKLHQAYREAWEQYPGQRRSHGVFCVLLAYDREPAELDTTLLRLVLEDSLATSRELLERAYASRRKDFQNPFRQSTFRNPREMEAVWGKLEDIPFLTEYREETERYCREVEELLPLLSG
jgi:hypothetical protein